MRKSALNDGVAVDQLLYAAVHPEWPDAHTGAGGQLPETVSTSPFAARGLQQHGTRERTNSPLPGAGPGAVRERGFKNLAPETKLLRATDCNETAIFPDRAGRPPAYPGARGT
jgi:hypothetical protein